MKTAAISLTFLISPAFCAADTFTLKDGTRLEGTVTGELDGSVLIKTAYGSLTINRADITQQVPAAAAEKPAPAETPVSSGPAAAQPPATEAGAAAGEPAAPEAAPAAEEPPPPLTFASLPGADGSRLLVYYSSGVAIATETYDAGGALLSLAGTVKNGTYSEYYPDGGLKTVKTMLGNKASGTMKAYYPSGVPQIEAYYFDGAKDGDFKYFGEDGKPLMTAAYKGDKLNGWKREYGPGGALATELYYQDDRPADPPAAAAAAAPAKAAPQDDSLVTAKTRRIARGEIFSLNLGGRYIGKLRLDNDFNVIEQDGDIPDGTVKVYGKDGKLQKELVFKKGELKVLRAYEESGAVAGVYTYKEGRALGFAVK